MKDVPYQEAVGSLMYIMTMTRPDIAFSVSQVAQFSKNPVPSHWNAVKRIFAYLAETPNHGLCFNNRKGDSIVGFTDADFAGDLDTRRSTSGYVFTLRGGPISWSSRRQTVTAQSTTESELVAVSAGTKEAVWLVRLQAELEDKAPEPTIIYCDNQSKISLIKNPVFHQRTKHIEVRFFYVRDQQADGKVNVRYVSTGEQLADIFTTPLAAPRYQMLRENLGVVLVGSPV